MTDSMQQGGLAYAGLGAFLGSFAGSEAKLTLTEIDDLIAPHRLPAEARKRQFWANAAGHHPTRRSQWLDAGFRAFLDPAAAVVTFVRALEQDTPWSEAELRACVAAYRLLQQAQIAGRKEVKADLRRRVLAESLKGRSEVAYEYRMQNITAVIEDLGLEPVRGYVARRNIGGAKPTIVALINEMWGRDSVEEEPTGDPDALDTRVLAARAKRKARGRSPPPVGSPGRARSTVVTNRFLRDPEVVAWVLEAAEGICEVCGDPAPFLRAGGDPYLEVHHVRWLALGGPDTVDNAVAACPNCHRQLHIGADREGLRRQLIRKVERLANHPKLALEEET